jgi:hypothetical protein
VSRTPTIDCFVKLSQLGGNVCDSLMNASIISAVAALAGAITGGLTSVLASWLTQHAQATAQWRAQDKLHRQELYKEFIETASKCYIHALQYDNADTPALVELYVRVGRMRILSSPKVVESAELVARRIVDTYLEPNKTFLELRELANSGSIDLLRDFSDNCREPTAVTPHGGFCGGESQQWLSYPTNLPVPQNSNRFACNSETSAAAMAAMDESISRASVAAQISRRQGRAQSLGLSWSSLSDGGIW